MALTHTLGQDGILRITLDRPQRLNAFDREMAIGFADAAAGAVKSAEDAAKGAADAAKDAAKSLKKLFK